MKPTFLAFWLFHYKIMNILNIPSSIKMTKNSKTLYSINVIDELDLLKKTVIIK